MALLCGYQARQQELPVCAGDVCIHYITGELQQACLMEFLATWLVTINRFETAGLPTHLVEHCNAMDEVSKGQGVVGFVGTIKQARASLPAHVLCCCWPADVVRLSWCMQVWVPTEFNRQTFIAAGVSARKLRVVEEGERVEWLQTASQAFQRRFWPEGLGPRSPSDKVPLYRNGSSAAFSHPAWHVTQYPAGINVTHWDPQAFTPLDPITLGPQQITGIPRDAGGNNYSSPRSVSVEAHGSSSVPTVQKPFGKCVLDSRL